MGQFLQHTSGQLTGYRAGYMPHRAVLQHSPSIPAFQHLSPDAAASLCLMAGMAVKFNITTTTALQGRSSTLEILLPFHFFSVSVSMGGKQTMITFVRQNPWMFLRWWGKWGQYRVSEITGLSTLRKWYHMLPTPENPLRSKNSRVSLLGKQKYHLAEPEKMVKLQQCKENKSDCVKEATVKAQFINRVINTTYNC